MDLDREKARTLGVQINEVFQAMSELMPPGGSSTDMQLPTAVGIQSPTAGPLYEDRDEAY